MERKQSKILIATLVLLWSFVVSAAGGYVMSYMSDILSFHMRWLLGTIFSTPPIAAVSLLAMAFKKKA